MPLLKSLDLFSGIGGITHALRGIARPVAYCDIDCTAQAILKANMRAGRLPRAPILPDVRLVRRDAVRGDVDMVVGGFPCVGFSTAGNMRGFEDAQSALFGSVIDVVAEFRPALVFLENVPAIRRLGMRTVLARFDRLGYDVRWTIMAAFEVGAPQSRRRWFMLATRRADPVAAVSIRRGSFEPYRWARPPPSMTLDVSPTRTARVGALGNAVVPDCVRTAFLRLVTLDAGVAATATGRVRVVAPPPAPPRARRYSHEAFDEGDAFPRSGAMDASGRVASLASLKTAATTRPDLRICVDPAAFSSTKPPSKARSSPQLQGPTCMTMYPTPRHGNTGASNFLSERTVRDLPTVVRFDVKTPRALRRGQVSAEFCEHLMGMPVGWTEHERVPRARRVGCEVL